MMKKPDQAPHPCLNVHFMVNDIDATLEKAQDAGATVTVPKMEIPNVGWHAGLIDPDGIFVGVFEANKQGSFETRPGSFPTNI